MAPTGPRRLGFFTRLLDQATAGERYRLATEQIVHVERHGFDSAWVAQFRNHLVDEVLEAFRHVGKHDVEAVATLFKEPLLHFIGDGRRRADEVSRV
jgi:hypothetical protein